ncbi:hypothetical protein ACVGOW_12370 [Pseudonocardia saturnea]
MDHRRAPHRAGSRGVAPPAGRVALNPGRHRLRVCCVGRDGAVLDAVPRPAFPDGGAGHHLTITVTVSGR